MARHSQSNRIDKLPRGNDPKCGGFARGSKPHALNP
jgi:hypothetical protein